MTDEEKQKVVMRPATPQDILTVTETIYHQSWGEGPTSVNSAFTRELSIQEQPYSRKIKIGETWQPLDLGWFSDRPNDVGMIQLVNEEGHFEQTQPTDEERAEAAAKVIELNFLALTNSWLILPRESFRGCPSLPGGVRIRCRSGVARATINVYPR